jgi:hypothetical protein
MHDDGFAAYDARQARSAEIWIADGAWSEAELPRRRWVAPRYALRGAVTVVAGPPSTMKSSLMLAWGCAAALGKTHGNFRPHAPCTVIVFNVEDDADEQHRRLSATLRQFEAGPTDIAGKLVCIGPRETGTLFASADDGEIVATPLMLRLREIITERRPALFIADPFAELHALDENSNADVRAVVAKFRALAVEFDMAVVLIHHTRKGTAEPGDPDVLRGGSAIVGGGRSIFTVLPMAEQDAKLLGLPSERKSRSCYVRLDDAKLNYADIGDAKWYEKTLYSLDNGETVPAAVPWTPPDFWRNLPNATINAILDQIDRGPAEGRRYSPAAQAAGDRAAWRVVTDHCSALTPEQARTVIATWLKNGMLESRPYFDPIESKKRAGLFVTRRPG